MNNKQERNFFSWNGNNLDWPLYSKWIVFLIIILSFVLFYIFRNKIKDNFNTDKKLFFIFKNRNIFYQTIGIMIILYTIVKIFLYEMNNYPLKWEYLQLHICRIHTILISLFLIIKKSHLIKYITYVSIVGALFAIYFGIQNKEYVNEGTIKSILLKDSYYNVGPDNLFYYDFFFIHIFLVLFPVYLWIGYRWNFSAKQFYIGQLSYVVGIFTIWLLNVAFVNLPIEWRSNNWYIGPDKSNDYNDALGPLSAWPQNLFSYLMIGLISYYSLHFIRISLLKDRKSEFRKFKIETKNIFSNIRNNTRTKKVD